MLALATSMLGACSQTPVAGPQSWDITSGTGQANPQNPGYALVRLNSHVIQVLAANAPKIAGAFTDKRAPEHIRFGVGDIVGITIFEAGSGGLFIPADSAQRTGNFVALPNQAVDTAGNISVPYAGTIRARGRTALELQQAIVDGLKDKALKPQAVVSLIDQRSTSYNVLGEVKSAGRFPALASGERVIDALSRAGGLSGTGNESWIVFEREGHRSVIPFGALVDVPSNNVYVRPNDTIYVFREPQTFMVFGAAGRQGQIPFEAWRVSLSEAIGKANGLSDISADPAAVFVYRGETRRTAELIGIDVTQFEGPVIPIVYNLDLRDPAGFFFASNFQMRSKDVLYVSNAQAVEVGKFLNYVRLAVATASDPLVSAATIKTLNNNNNNGGTVVSIPPAIQIGR
jgi:polysaccharide export outer membrane protein